MTHLVFKRSVTPIKPPESEPEISPAEAQVVELIKGQGVILEYLQLTSQERATLEAEAELKAASEHQEELEREIAELKRTTEGQGEFRGELESQILGLKHELEVPRQSPKETAGLRKLLRESDDDAVELRTAIVGHEREIALLKEAGEKARVGFDESLTAANNKAPQVITKLPVKPENIDFVYHREMNGLLSRVILKAEGYGDVEVGIVRGADGRMHHLKIGETQ